MLYINNQELVITNMKNLLINFSKNYNFLFLIISFNSLSAMDGMDKLMRVFKPEEIISRKDSGFDFLKLHEIKPWYGKLSEKQKTGILDNLRFIQSKKNQALFRVAVELPPDIQRLVVAHMLDGYSYTHYAKESPNNHLGGYANAVNKFYKISMITSFQDHCKALNFTASLNKLYKQKGKGDVDGCSTRASIRRYGLLYFLINDPNFQLHIIFELLDDFLMFTSSDLWKIDSRHMSKNEIESLMRLSDKFSDLLKEVKRIQFSFCDTYTIDNFKKYCCRKQFVLLPFLLAPFVSQLIAKSFYETYEYIDQGIVEKNKIKEFINSSLQNKYEQTGHSLWLSERRSLENPLVHVDKIDYNILLKKGFIYSVAYPLFLFILDDKRFSQQLKANGVLGNILIIIPLSIIGAISGGLCWGIKKVLLYSMPQIMRSLLNRPLAGIVCVTGLYALIVAWYNIKQMRTVQTGTVSFEDLSALLERTDIVIK